MSILHLPNELIIQVIGYLSGEQDINALVRTCKRAYNLLNDELYCNNIRNNGSHALFWAVHHGRENTLRRLLHLGADTEHIREEDGFALSLQLGYGICERPLHIAARMGSLPIVQILLDAGADTMAVTSDAQTPLCIAIDNKRAKIACTIYRYMKHGPDVTIASPFMVARHPLHVAAQSGQPNLVLFFLQQGADTNLKDGQRATPLYYAMLRSDYEITRMLLEHGADMDIVNHIAIYDLDGDFTGYRGTTCCRTIGRDHPNNQIRALTRVWGKASSAGLSRVVGPDWKGPSIAITVDGETLSFSKPPPKPKIDLKDTVSFPCLATNSFAISKSNSKWTSSTTKDMIKQLENSQQPLPKLEKPASEAFPQLGPSGSVRAQSTSSDTWARFTQQGLKKREEPKK